MGISKSGCSKSITKTDLDRAYKQGFADCAEIMHEYQKELQALKAKQEQGLLIELPCKVGDTVYFISREEIIPVEIDSIAIHRKVLLFYGTNEEHYGYSKITLSNEGNLYFTRSEAEEALAKMGGK